MIKMRKMRYNSIYFRIYYPHVNPSLQHCIVIEWTQKDRVDTIITFNSEKERDDEIEAWDEALLIVKDGKIVERGLPINLPFVVDGGIGGPGAINLQ